MSLLLPILPISTMSPMACHPCQVSLVSSSQHQLAHPPLLKLVSIWPECPPLPPFLGHLCVPPAHDCYYDGGNDQCCCSKCPEIVRFSCIPDKITGSGRWKSDLCPEGPEGCGSKGEWWTIILSSSSKPQVLLPHQTTLANILTTLIRPRPYKWRAVKYWGWSSPTLLFLFVVISTAAHVSL